MNANLGLSMAAMGILTWSVCFLSGNNQISFTNSDKGLRSWRRSHREIHSTEEMERGWQVHHETQTPAGWGQRWGQEAASSRMWHAVRTQERFHVVEVFTGRPEVILVPPSYRWPPSPCPLFAFNFHLHQQWKQLCRLLCCSHCFKRQKAPNGSVLILDKHHSPVWWSQEVCL